MKRVVPLEEAHEEALFGAKAVGLGQAIRDGLPVPPGFALSGDIVEAVASGETRATQEVVKRVRPLGGPLAVRSSAVDEDGASASFAGQHLTLLNVRTADDVSAALNKVWWSANSDSAITYRQKIGRFTRPSVGVVVQALLDPEAAGVMFTTNPVTGDDERVIEAAWGLGEAVVAALVIPDNFRIDRQGNVLERIPGYKKIAVRRAAEGGTIEDPLPPHLVEALSLNDDHLRQLHELASRCEVIYGPGRDIEWALSDGKIFLLQCRAITKAGA
ncbi:MAG TPA: PEP/pyruvate-binding domain-containing protein [Candidatus Polarisedimenticolaceae bacterium]|nr:PEP/pyruvate-binding domain-containing protein [Candidatus Polarisedimenticolaceae bacterium]